MGEDIFGVILTGFIMGICALIMIAVGVSQRKNKKPVGFYTNQKPPEATELTDVSEWNKKHGMMWIVYGIVIALTWVAMQLLGEGGAFAAFFIGILVPPIVMIFYHNSLKKQLLIRQSPEE